MADFRDEGRAAAVDRFIDSTRLAERGRALDAKPEFPWAEFRSMASAGLLGLRTPRESGGQGLSMLESARVLGRLAYRSGTTFAKLSLQPEFCSVLREHGSTAEHRRAFEGLIRGEKLIGNQITEPEAGSDAASLKMRAERHPGGYRLNGAKSEIAFATDAAWAIVYARTSERRPGEPGISAFLVDQSLPGIRASVVADLGERWMRRGSVAYRDVDTGTESLLGEEGRAFSYLKEELVRERALLAAIYLAVARASFDETVAYVGQREAFGRRLSDNQAVSFPLVDDGMHLEAAQLLVERTLSRIDSGQAKDSESAVAKVLATETALETLDHAIQFHGGRGYSSALPHEQRWRDVRSGALAHGSSEIMRRLAAEALWPRPRPARVD
jgi:alkylation response protein AidB-like acyl-CoA dehydrogenase